MGHEIGFVALAGRFDHFRNIEEVDALLKELGHGFFVGGIHHGGHRSPCAARGIGQFHAWIFLGIGCPEAELSHFREIKAPPRCFQSGRPAQAIQDG